MNSLKSLIKDDTSGSVELTIKLNRILNVTPNSEGIKNILTEVENNLKSFAALDNYISNVREILSSNDMIELKNFLSSYESKLNNLNNRIFKNAKPYIGCFTSFLTLSNSYTILQVLKKLDTINKIDVFVCESRPALEGKILADKLAENNVKVKVIADKEMSVFIPKVDAVILGADKIFINGNVINKTGSLSAAIISNDFNKPVYVIADRTKIVLKNKKEENQSVQNNLFEEVPAKLITKIITD